MNDSHPGKPVKEVYVDCPKCYSAATHMIHKGNGVWYCPNCSHSCQFDQPTPKEGYRTAKVANGVEDQFSSYHPSPRATFRATQLGAKHTFPDGVVVATSPSLSRDSALIDEEYARAVGELEDDEDCNHPSKPVFRAPAETTQTMKQPEHPPQKDIGEGRTSVGPTFELIPTIALVRLAERFMLGEERKGDKAWNAMSKNQSLLLNKEFLINRLGHIIHHCYKLRDKVAVLRYPKLVCPNCGYPDALEGCELECDTVTCSACQKDFDPELVVDFGDDDAGAIAWGGMFAICATEAMKNASAP